MRIALIILALTAFAFIGSIVYTLFGKESGLTLPTKTQTTKTETPMELETLKYQIKNEQKIDELSKKIDSLVASQGGIIVGTNSDTSTGAISSWTTNPTAIPLSGKFLSQVMPTLEFTLTKNTGIYELLIFDKTIEYSTYLDAKQGIKAQPLSIKYDLFLKNMKAVPTSVYTVNETKTFPFRSFYVNPPKADTLVRLVIEVESQVIVLEVPKTKFENFKKMLLKK